MLKLFCFVIFFGEVLSVHDALLDLKKCCLKGRFDPNTQKCITNDERNYPPAILCRELVSEKEFSEEDMKEAGHVCVADVLESETGRLVKEHFVCDEFEKCCTSGKFDQRRKMCVDPTTSARYTFSLYCRKFVPDEEVAAAALFTSNNASSDVCVEKIADVETTTEAYLTCEKINYELALTFETWLYPFSIAFLLLTLYYYVTELKDLRSAQDIAFMFAVACLAAHMILHMARYSKSIAWVTLVYNYAGRYFKTAYFSWFNVMVLSRLFENRNLANNNYFENNIRPFWRHLYAWSVPMLFIIIYICYPRMNWHIPILCLWIVNVILLLAAIAAVEYDRTNFEKLIWERNHYRTWLLVRLFMGAGVLWVFGAKYRIPIFTSLFALQGILVFLIMVIYRYSAKRMLGGVKCFCFTFPKKWKQIPRIDEDNVASDVTCNNTKDDDSYVLRIPLDI
ncbi:uncharacterized protein LOC134835928 [Culicoides brevitarsis]|uniref:uncharacterized protein LOC134835928 n=1 Tax=Culicoides brevitarsis TaxID=469753 RepID=UPI00307B1B4C